MKRIIAIIILLSTIIGCGACQPTPSEPIVISKGDGALQSTVYGTPAPLGKYEAQGVWQEDIDTSKSGEEYLKIQFDAQITVPDVNAYPVYRVSPHTYTESEADSFISAFIGDEELYTIRTWRTKDRIMGEIIKKQTILDDLDNPDSKIMKILRDGGYTGDEYRKKVVKDIDRLQEEYKTAPASYELDTVDRKFVNALVQLTTAERIYGFTSDGKRCISIIRGSSEMSCALKESKYYLSDVNNADDGFEYMAYINDSMDWSTQTHNLNGVTISYDEAKAVADDTVKNKLGYTNWEVSFSASEYYMPTEYDENTWRFIMNKTRADDPQRYVFIYTQVIDGIPLLYYAYDTQVNNSFGFIWKQQALSVIVDDNGIYSVSEISSLDLRDCLNTNVSLLPFERIKDIARTYMPLKANYDNPYGWYDKQTGEFVPFESMEGLDNPESITLRITDVRLGYVRIKEKDASQTSGLLVPVWIFYGDQIDHYASKKDSKYDLDDDNNRIVTKAVATPYLCINAIDGSIIDLTQGY